MAWSHVPGEGTRLMSPGYELAHSTLRYSVMKRLGPFSCYRTPGYRWIGIGEHCFGIGAARPNGAARLASFGKKEFWWSKGMTNPDSL